MRLLLILSLFITQSAWGQTQNLKLLLDNYFKAIVSGKDAAIPKEILSAENSKPALEKLLPFETDSNDVVRTAAYHLVKTIGVASTAPAIRSKAIQQLVSGLKDADQHNSVIACEHLKDFSKNDFSDVSRERITELFRSSENYFPEFIRLIGFLEAQKNTSNLQSLSQPGNDTRIRWASLLALSRMGDASATADILKRVKKAGVNDDVVYDIFPDLIYTRNKDVFAYLLEILNSDEKNCESADTERGGKIPCAYRVMEMLAPVIKDYPLTLDASGDIKTKDYAAALKTVRDWFRQHPNYTILKNTY